MSSCCDDVKLLTGGVSPVTEREGCHTTTVPLNVNFNFTSVSPVRRDDKWCGCDVTKGTNTTPMLVTPPFVGVGSASCINRIHFSFKLCQKNLGFYQKDVNRGLNKLGSSLESLLETPSCSTRGGCIATPPEDSNSLLEGCQISGVSPAFPLQLRITLPCVRAELPRVAILQL